MIYPISYPPNCNPKTYLTLPIKHDTKPNCYTNRTPHTIYTTHDSNYNVQTDDAANNNMSESSTRVTFQAFFDAWLLRQHSFLHKLRQAAASHDNDGLDHQPLIDQVISHYHQLYEEKARGARDDVVLFLSPPWLSLLERTLLWIGGDKPSLIVRLASLVDSIDHDQRRRVDDLKAQVRRQERHLTDAMAVIQESLAAPPVLNLARRFGRLVDGEVSDLDAAMEMLKVMMVDALERADALRGSTLRRVVEILSPVQTVRFLAAAAEFLIRIRTWGMERDAQREAA